MIRLSVNYNNIFLLKYSLHFGQWTWWLPFSFFTLNWALQYGHFIYLWVFLSFHIFFKSSNFFFALSVKLKNLRFSYILFWIFLDILLYIINAITSKSSMPTTQNLVNIQIICNTAQKIKSAVFSLSWPYLPSINCAILYKKFLITIFLCFLFTHYTIW